MRSQNLLVLYSVVLAASFLEYIFPPFPSDTILLFSGFLAGEHVLDPYAIFVLTMVGAVVGAICLYELGFRKGRRFFYEKDYRVFPRERIVKLEKWFGRHGGKIIIVNRFFSGFRSLFFIAAGIGRMDLRKVVVFGALGSAIWTILVLVAGYLVGRNWQMLHSYLRLYSSAVLIAATVALAALLLFRYIKGRRTYRERP
jgi:membrane protein DedA with SNARE-associated domain